jgi:SAM-dependent methyltransferase
MADPLTCRGMMSEMAMLRQVTLVRGANHLDTVSMMDRSNGYEGVSVEFLGGRGSGRSAGIGVIAVRKWARTLPSGATVIDLGCGPGFPITDVLVTEGLNVFGVDAAPSFIQAFRGNLPNIPVACEAVQDSSFFDRTFDGVLAWGLMFLLCPEDQRCLIPRIADIMVPGGRLLFTSPAEPLVWNENAQLLRRLKLQRPAV